MILLLIDTGMRREECAGITHDDLELDQIVWVLGKGRRPRALPLGRRTAVALDRYLRVRDGHRLTYLPGLWLGRGGRPTPSGYATWSTTAPLRPAFPRSTPTSCALPSPRPGSPRAATKTS
jgi:integrase